MRFYNFRQETDANQFFSIDTKVNLPELRRGRTENIDAGSLRLV
jgi:hypothetical protein